MKSKNRPLDMPYSPDQSYRDWKTWGEFLGTGRIADQFKLFKPYKDAKKIIQKYKFLNNQEYFKFTQTKDFKNLNIPHSPNNTYNRKKYNYAWEGWGEFLGSGNYQSIKKLYSFKKAKLFARSLNLKSSKDWSTYAKNNTLPDGMPVAIHGFYSKNKKWKGLPEFLGSNSRDPKKVSESFVKYHEAKKIIKNYKILNTKDWKIFSTSGKRPEIVPAAPDRFYKNKGWKGWGDFLSSNLVSGRKYNDYLTFEKIKNEIKKFNLKDERSWRKFKKTSDFKNYYPRNPDKFYKKQWKGFPDFLGRERYSRK
jgi:hypothetical protein